MLLDLLFEELVEILINFITDFLVESIESFVDVFINNKVFENLLQTSRELGVLLIVLFMIIMITKNIATSVNKTEIIHLIGRFIFLIFFFYALKPLAFSFLDMVMEYALSFNSVGIKGLFTSATSSVYSTFPLSSLVYFIIVLCILIFYFFRFLLDYAKYCLMLIVTLTVFPFYAIETLANGYLEFLNYIFQIARIYLSIFLLSLFMSLGFLYLGKSILALQGGSGSSIANLLIAIVMLTSKSTIEKALGKLGIFSPSGNPVSTINQAGSTVRNITLLAGGKR